MFNRIFVLFFVFLMAFFSSASQNSDAAQKETAQKTLTKANPLLAKSILPFKKGEKIKYDIRSMGVKAGEAVLSFEGLKREGAKEVYVIVFTAKALNFFDDEKIYADPKTFYPIKVERNLNIWGKKEKITEEYDQDKKVVSVIKNNGTRETIKRNGPIDNLYCFIYRYRKQGNFKIGDSFSMRLPTKNVAIKLVKMTSLKAAGKNYNTFYMQSDPAKYKVWFDTSDKKIPLRINGSVGINNTAMTMTSFSEGEK